MEYRPLLDYWLKMASATFGCIGIASLCAGMRPHRFEGMIRLLGPFYVFLGVVLTVAAIKNHLSMDAHPTFVADITFCFLTALLISVPLGVSYFRNR
jgi:predicted anti-sigma-YlaC factor YlaD